MDFVSLVGSSAYLAKQLELRWFYQWEPSESASSSSVSTSTAAEHSQNTRRRGRRSSCSSAESNNQAAPPLSGRLVRKYCHSMPFLRRNMIACGGDLDGLPQPSGIIDAARGDNSGSFAKGASSPPKHKRALGESQNSKDNKRRARGKKTMMTAADVASAGLKSEEQDRTSSQPAQETLESFLQNSMERQKVLDNVPVEIHHDEVFVMERMKGSWLESNSSGFDTRISVSSDTINSGKIASVVTKSKGGNNHTGDNAQETFKATTNIAAEASIVLPPNAVLPLMNQSGSQPRRGSATLKSRNQLPPAYFHYLFMQPNNVPATLVEEIDGRVCPFCNFDGTSNEGLLRHCGRYHGTVVDTTKSNKSLVTSGETDCAYFEAALGEEGQLHVIMRGLPMLSPQTASTNHIHDNFTFVQPRLYTPGGIAKKSTSQQTKVPFLHRQHHKAASLDMATRNKKLLALQSNNAPASAISAYLPNDTIPLRQYFHARTNLPMSHGEWMEDSDRETDETWLHEMSSELLDEFEDVSAKEKQFMKLWNRFIKRNHVIADKDIPGKCNQFIVKHQKELKDGELRLNLLLHLFNLWDSGVISSSRILSCMSLFDGSGDEDGVGHTMLN